MKGMWTFAMLALLAGAAWPAPAGAAKGGNSANAHLCQQGGWKALYRGDGSTFANQDECVSYGAHGNAISIDPPDPWKTACEQAGGTFSISDTDARGQALTPPAYAYLCSPVSLETWVTVLTPICFSFPDTTAIAGWNGQIGDCVRKGTS